MGWLYSHRNRQKRRLEPDESIVERPIPSYKISR